LVTAFSRWALGSNPPVRLAVFAEKRVVLVGESFGVTIELHDAFNMATRSAQHYKVTVEMRSGHDIVQTMMADISPPESRTRVVLTARREGVWMIKALNPQLREDATYVRVRSSAALRHQSSPVRVVNAARRREPVLLLKVGYEEQLPPAARGEMEIDLYYSDQGGKFIANGRDAVRITAFPSDTPKREIKLLIHNSGGVLTPNPLVIPAGADSAETLLTSEQAGPISVEVVGVRPPNAARVSKGLFKSVEFYIPIKELAVFVSPPKVPLGDSATIQCQLLDLNGGIVRVSDAQDVHFRMTSGLGAFEAETVRIDAGQDECQTHFTPKWFDQVQFSASTFGATVREDAETVKLRTLSVTFPWPYVFLYFLPAFLASLVRSFSQGARLKEASLGAAVMGLTALFVIGTIQLGLVRFWDPKTATNVIAGTLVVALGVGLGLIKPPKFDLGYKPAKS
jgi:hypothetical protein